VNEELSYGISKEQAIREIMGDQGDKADYGEAARLAAYGVRGASPAERMLTTRTGPPPLAKYGQARVTPPELLHACRRHPQTGEPLVDEALPVEFKDENEARWDRHVQAQREFRDLGPQGISQLVCDLWYGAQADRRLWRCCLADGAQPELLLRASDSDEAKQRYFKVCGITSATEPDKFPFLSAVEPGGEPP
jgi:hypothetical protein